MSRWNERDDVARGSDYDARWASLEATGAAIHGEADLVHSFAPETVLDAGCGTGRVAIELASRGIAVVGVDLDASMLATARDKAPSLRWIRHDLLDVELRDSGGGLEQFDMVALAGNVMIFVAPGTEPGVIANLTRHLVPHGRLIAGFQLNPGSLGIDEYDRFCAQAGLRLEHRWSTWDRQPFEGGDYVVSVHRLDR